MLPNWAIVSLKLPNALVLARKYSKSRLLTAVRSGKLRYSSYFGSGRPMKNSPKWLRGPPGAVSIASLSPFTNAGFICRVASWRKPSTPSAFQKPAAFSRWATTAAFSCEKSASEPSSLCRKPNRLLSLPRSPRPWNQPFVSLFGSASRFSTALEPEQLNGSPLTSKQ